MTEAISELSHLAASGRDARLFECLWQAQAALSFAQRGSVPHTVHFLLRAQREARLHHGACNDYRAMNALERVRRECATALTVKARTKSTVCRAA